MFNTAFVVNLAAPFIIDDRCADGFGDVVYARADSR